MTLSKRTPTSSVPPSAIWHAGMLAKGGARQCGSGRTAGSIYVEAGQPCGGIPVEQFLTDAPWSVDPDQIHITPMGVTLLEKDGVTHILDWVGSEHYEYPADFIEEARRMGVSRKIPVGTNLSGITPQSTIMLLHKRGSVRNARAVSAASSMLCPSGQHKRGEDCAGLHWVIPGQGGTTRRQLTCGTYEVTPLPPHAPDPEYVPAIFMVIPISALTIIRNHDGSISAQAQNAVERSGFMPVIVDL
ncbi:hypothetical protein [Deinococcus ficus]|uniref:Uncharacterized protein n=1 Tax=Deinococcus ficus TaxID=317577 RepID=A0A221T2S6_9DEIO|nr:hypothetical protein [Deinococcus ficus]ASN83208.1 hypothetical protein DFI_18590 [Deinococcus ficus]